MESKDFSLDSDGKGESVGRENQSHLCYNVEGDLSAFYPCLETLLKAEFGTNSRPQNLQCRHCWLFLDLQWDDKNRGEGCVKPSNLSRRELYVKSRVRNLLAKEISDIRKKPSILHKGSRKAAFRACWGWQDASYGTKEYESMNALKKTFL